MSFYCFCYFSTDCALLLLLLLLVDVEEEEDDDDLNKYAQVRNIT